MSQDDLVVFPDLSIKREDNSVEIENKPLRLTRRFPLAALEVLESIRAHRSAARLGAAHAPVLAELVQHFCILPRTELSYLQNGLLYPEGPPVGEAVSLTDLPGKLAPGAFCIVGFPSGLAATCAYYGDASARLGPSAIRSAYGRITGASPNKRASAEVRILDLERRREFVAAELQTGDVGNVFFLPGEGLDVVGARLRKAVERIRNAGLRPVVLGGDHSTTWFPLQVLLSQGPMGLIHFDAHHDTYLPHQPLNHANAFAQALQHPNLAALFQVGLRTLEASRPVGNTRTTDARLSFVSSRELQRMTPEQVFANLRTDLPYYLTFDVDCLSPEVAPDTGTPVAGGLSYYQALDLLEYAARRFTITGMDFVEVAGPISGLVVGRLLHEVLLTSLQPQPLGSYYFVKS